MWVTYIRKYPTLGDAKVVVDHPDQERITMDVEALPPVNAVVWIRFGTVWGRWYTVVQHFFQEDKEIVILVRNH